MQKKIITATRISKTHNSEGQNPFVMSQTSDTGTFLQQSVSQDLNLRTECWLGWGNSPLWCQKVQWCFTRKATGNNFPLREKISTQKTSWPASRTRSMVTRPLRDLHYQVLEVLGAAAEDQTSWKNCECLRLCGLITARLSLSLLITSDNCGEIKATSGSFHGWSNWCIRRQ